MQISADFYEVVATLIPVLLIALAVEQFAINNDDKKPSSFAFATWTIALLTVAEAVSLGVVAHGSSSQLADTIMVIGLALGWMGLVLSYLSKVLDARPKKRRWPRRWLAMIVAPGLIAVLCPPVAMWVYLIAAAS
jgi:hypothetical protein